MKTLSITDDFIYLSRLFLSRKPDYILIDGEQIADKETFLKAFAEQLGFPDYFGHNWDAFYDCMTDLSWREGHNDLLIVYKNPQRFKKACPADWSIANEILLDIIDYWHKEGRTIALLFL